MNYSTAYTSKAAEAPANDTNFCVPLAIALVSDKSFQEVNDLLIRRGYRRPRKGVTTSNILKACDEMGIRLSRLTYQERVGTRGVKTMVTAARGLRDGVFLVMQRRHIAAVAWGEVMDWSKDRRNKIEAVYQVVNSPLPNPRRHPVTPRPASTPTAWPSTPSPTFAPPRPANVVKYLAAELNITPSAVRRRARAAGLSAPYNDLSALRRALGAV